MSDDLLLVYITAPAMDVARHIARTVVAERLAACANILPGVTAIYAWEGRMEEAGEVALFLKTSRQSFDLLEERVKALHPYECPCIVGLPLSLASKNYAEWITQNLGKGLL